MGLIYIVPRADVSKRTNFLVTYSLSEYETINRRKTRPGEHTMRSLHLQGMNIVLVASLMTGCWANPAAVRIASTPAGAKVWYQERELGVTPINTTLECDEDTQFVHIELTGYKSRDITLTKKKIKYY